MLRIKVYKAKPEGIHEQELLCKSCGHWLFAVDALDCSGCLFYNNAFNL